jgi:hypothetical protein
MFLHCDRDGCPSQQDADTAMEGSGWQVLHKWDSEGELQHFCGTPCLLAHAAQFEVPETVPHDEGGRG